MRLAWRRVSLWCGLAVILTGSLPAGGSAAEIPSSSRLLWASVFPGFGGTDDFARALVSSPDGSRVFVAGYATGTNWDFTTLAYDAATGQLLWARRIDRAGYLDIANDIAISPDGSKVFVTGTVTGSSLDGDDLTVAYDAATGTALWSETYGRAGSSETGERLAVAPDGSTVYVTGSSEGTTQGTDFTSVAYESATGALLWLQRYDERESETPESIAVGPDGSRVYITGVSGDAFGTEDYLTVAEDGATGAVLWARRYDGTGASHDDAHSIASSPGGSAVFVTGESYGSGPGTPPEFATVAYDAISGNPLWVARYRRKGDLSAQAYSVAVSPDGSRVFVAGGADSQVVDGSSDRTLAYDAATGSVLWERRYVGPWYGSNRADDLAVSADGSTVLITGLGTGRLQDADSVTIAYDARTGLRRWLLRFHGPRGSDEWTLSIAVSVEASTIWIAGGLGLDRRRHILTVAYDVGGSR